MAEEVEYEKYENYFKETALPHFVRSISSVLVLARIATNVGTRELEDTDFSNFRDEVETANKEAQESAKAARDLVDLIDGTCEKLTAQHGQVTRDRKELEGNLQSAQGKVRSLESEKELINGRLQTAKASLRQVEGTLRAARAKKGEKQTGRDVGIGLSFLLPCVGIPMAVAFEKERQYSMSEVDAASDDRSSLESSIKRDEEQLDQISGQLPELYNQTDRDKESLEESKAIEVTLKGSRAGLAKVQGRMKNCCQYLTSFQGKVGALNAQSQYMYSLSPLLPFLEEACVQAQQVPDKEALFDHIQVHRVGGDLETLLPKIKELLMSQDSTDYMK